VPTKRFFGAIQVTVKLILKDLLITGMKVISTMLVDIAQTKLPQTSGEVC
jgi:hypothetical protein